MNEAGEPTEGTPPSTPTQPAPTPAASAPASIPPSGWQTPRGGGAGSGCVKIALILVTLVVVAAVGLLVLAGTFVNNLAPGGDGEGLIGGGDCPFLADADAQAVLGGQADALELEGLYDASIGIIIDKRVLPEAPDCFVTEGERAFLARIAVADGNGAGVFAAERQRAEPSSQDQGGGVTLENPGYFGGDVPGLGDEAFCTGISDAIMGGVLVRQGDRVVYVSVGAPEEGQQVPDMDMTPDGVVTSPGLCGLAQELAQAVLE